MNWEQALEITVKRHPRHKELCAENHPDKDYWRAEVIKMAMNEHQILLADKPVVTIIKPPEREVKVEKPSVLNQIKSAGTTAIDFAKSGFKRADQNEQERRLEICRKCEHFDGSRCDICGCYMKWKASIESAHCPLPEPKW